MMARWAQYRYKTACLMGLLLIGVCVNIAYMLHFRGCIHDSKTKVIQVQDAYQCLMQGDPSPHSSNILALDAALLNIDQYLKSLQPKWDTPVDTSPVSVRLQLEQDVVALQRRFHEAQIAMPAMQYTHLYLDPNGAIPSADSVSLILEQHAYVQAIFDMLIAAQPHAITAYNLELLRPNSQWLQSSKLLNSLSVLHPITVYTITFKGHTQAVRLLLNSLAFTPLNIVVRSLKFEVEPSFDSGSICEPQPIACTLTLALIHSPRGHSSL